MFRSTALDTLISSRVLEGSLPLKHEKEGSELGGEQSTPGMTVDQFTGPEAGAYLETLVTPGRVDIVAWAPLFHLAFARFALPCFSACVLFYITLVRK